MDWKQEIFKRLDVLAEKMGTTAQYLWHILVKQGFATGVADLTTAGLLLIPAVALVFLGKKLLKLASTTGYEPPETMGGIASLAVAILLAVAVGTNLYNGLLEVINPEYFALQELLKAIK